VAAEATRVAAEATRVAVEGGRAVAHALAADDTADDVVDVAVDVAVVHSMGVGVADIAGSSSDVAAGTFGSRFPTLGPP